MSFSRESTLFVDSDTSLNAAPLANQDPNTDEEDFKIIDDTIKSVSRNMRRGDWAYLCEHPEVIKTLEAFQALGFLNIF